MTVAFTAPCINISTTTTTTLPLTVVWLQISLSKVRFLIFDEADRMLDMGFLPSMRKLVDNPDMPGKGDRQALMFSATFPEEVQRLAQEILGDRYLFLVVGRVGGANMDIEQTVYNVDNLGKREKVLSILNESEQFCLFSFCSSMLTVEVSALCILHGNTVTVKWTTTFLYNCAKVELRAAVICSCCL